MCRSGHCSERGGTLQLRKSEVVRSDDVCCSLVKRSTHMLDEDEDFRRMKAAVEDVWSCYLAYDLTSPGSG